MRVRAAFDPRLAAQSRPRCSRSTGERRERSRPRRRPLPADEAEARRNRARSARARRKRSTSSAAARAPAWAARAEGDAAAFHRPARRHRVPRAGGDDAARQGRHAARATSRRRSPRTARCCPSSRSTIARSTATRRRADRRRPRRRQRLGAAPHQRRRGARQPDRPAPRQRPRRSDQDRRPGDEERHRPRSRQAHLRRARHARPRHRGDVQAAAEAAERGDARPAPPRRRRGASRRCRARSARPIGVSGAAAICRRHGPRILRARCCASRVSPIRSIIASSGCIALLADLGAEHALRGEDSQRLWRAMRDAEFLAEPRERAIWRVSLAPSKGAAASSRGSARRALSHFYDWGGGLVWLASEPREARAAAVRAALAPLGGHATLVRAPDALRAARRRVRAAVAGARAADARRQGELRSRTACSTPAGCIAGM